MAQLSPHVRRYGGPIVVLVGLAWIIAYFTGELDAIAITEKIHAWNFVIGFTISFIGVALTLIGLEPQGKTQIGNRWAAPLMIASAVIGLVWIIAFYTIGGTSHNLPVLADLGNWNLIVGMGYIVGAFAFAMKWE